MSFRKTIRSAVPAAFLLIFAGTAVGADQYKIDHSHSSVEFSVRHMVISNVKGGFDEFDGSILFDPENIENSSVEFSINTASINTKEEKRDDHLRSPDFFDAAKYPNITFKSSAIKKTSDGHVAVGTLTIRGVSKQIELPFRLSGPVTNPRGQAVLGVEVEYKLNRQDFGVSWSQKLDTGGLVVGDEVKVELNIEAQKS